MKKLLISTSIAALMASNSMVSFASSVPTLIQFTTGTKAVAADVNANFNDVATSVDDNNDRIDINAQAITDLGGTTTCSDDMVAVGSSSLCVDLYEASVWTAATGGSQIDTSINPLTRCATDGSDCGKDALDAANTAIYARSIKTVAGVFPNARVSWYQAAQACANVDKRLPTTAEWQLAASGTPSGTGDGVNGCNAFGGNSLQVTGNAANCVSNVGAFDMVGNVAEWSADLRASSGNDIADAWGDTKSASGGNGTPSTRSVFTPSVAVNQTPEVGFRCVK